MAGCQHTRAITFVSRVREDVNESVCVVFTIFQYTQCRWIDSTLFVLLLRFAASLANFNNDSRLRIGGATSYSRGNIIRPPWRRNLFSGTLLSRTLEQVSQKTHGSTREVLRRSGVAVAFPFHRGSREDRHIVLKCILFEVPSQRAVWRR